MRRASGLQRADVESDEAERPPRRTRATSMSAPDVLVGVDEALDAVLRHERDELREVVNVLRVVETAVETSGQQVTTWCPISRTVQSARETPR